MERLRLRSPALKPMPKTDQDICDEAKALGLCSLNNVFTERLSNQPRVKLIDAIYQTSTIKRSPKQFSLLFVGPTGAGKSSTVNHLFGLRDTDTKIKAAPSQTGNESETRETSEYILTGDYPDYGVCDLELGIVDTPGFPDSDGMIQDACNFASIKKFYNLHPNLKGCYPNLILILARCIDQCGGIQTPFVKCLRYLAELDFVDKIRPNIIGVLTFPCSIKPNYDRNIEKWEEKLEQRRIWIQDKIFEVLNVKAPVVVIENHFDEEELVRPENSDYTKLPNEELQPRNLFIAANSILESNNDILGQVIFHACFLETKKLQKLGFSIKATRAKTRSDLSTEEKHSIYFIESDTRTGMNDPIFLKAKEFIDTKKLKGEDKSQIQEIAVKLTELEVGDIHQLEDITQGLISYHMDDKITPVGSDFLTTMLGVKEAKKPITCPLIGQGYNILTDKPTPGDILDVGLKSSEYGIMIPNCAKLEKVTETRTFEEYFKDTKEYIQYRLNNVNINFNVDSNVVNMQSRAGFNDLSKMSENNDERQYSFLYEKRLYKIKMGNFDGIPITDDFRLDVQNLPDTYHKNEQSNRARFQMFFARWGHFIVTSAYGGGSIEMKSTRPSTEVGSHELQNVQGHLSLTSVFYGIIGVSGYNSSASGSSTSSIVNQNSFNCVGGSIEFHDKHMIEDTKLLKKWEQSLIIDPMMLTTELSLEPISTILGFVAQSKQQACYNALRDLLGVDLVITGQQNQRKKGKKNKHRVVQQNERGTGRPNRQEATDLTRAETVERNRPRLPSWSTIVSVGAFVLSIVIAIARIFK